MDDIKTLEQAKERITKLELIISWLTDGNNDSIEAEYDNEMMDYEDE